VEEIEYQRRLVEVEKGMGGAVRVYTQRSKRVGGWATRGRWRERRREVCSDGGRRVRSDGNNARPRVGRVEA
jgi:hypothetical protein